MPPPEDRTRPSGGSGAVEWYWRVTDSAASVVHGPVAGFQQLGGVDAVVEVHEARAGRVAAGREHAAVREHGQVVLAAADCHRLGRGGHRRRAVEVDRRARRASTSRRPRRGSCPRRRAHGCRSPGRSGRACRGSARRRSRSCRGCASSCPGRSRTRARPAPRRSTGTAAGSATRCSATAGSVGRPHLGRSTARGDHISPLRSG